MVNYVKYVKDGGKNVTYGRAYREALFFQLINYCNESLPDSAEDVYGYEIEPYTYKQKCRFRNEAFRILNEKVKEYNETHDDKKDLYDTDLIIESFFESNMGKNYINKKVNWTGEDSVGAEYIKTIREWTYDQLDEENPTLRCLVSPYDPWFHSDLFDDETDAMGYIVGAIDYDGNALLNSSGKSYIPSIDKKSAIIRSLNIADGSDIRSFDDRVEIADSGLKKLDGRLAAMGYYDIEHYIKPSKNKDAIKKYLLSRYPDENEAPPITEDSLKFAVELCKYLTEEKPNFVIDVMQDNGSENIVAKFPGTKTHIRMFDFDSPQYQGRIYDDGKYSYISSQRIQHLIKNGMQDSFFTWEDRMKAIKWRFGTNMLKLESTSKLLSDGSLSIGEYKTLTGMDDYAGSMATVARADIKKQSDKMGVLLGVRTIVENGREVAIPITLQLTSSPYTRQKDSLDRMISDGIVFTDADFIRKKDKIASLIPDEFVLPGDIIVDENGNRTFAIKPIENAEQSNNIQLSDFVGFENIEYYKHVIINERLKEWTNSAKDTYRAEVNVQALFDLYENSGDTVEPGFSSGKNVGDLQDYYWDILCNGINGDTDTTLDERKEFINNNLSATIDEMFGFVPDIPHKGLSIDNTNKPGINIENVANYMGTSESQGNMKNYDLFRHLLFNLGDDYNSGYIYGDNYINNEIRNNMIKFDENSVIASINVGTVLGTAYTDEENLDKNLIPALDNTKLRDMPVSKEMMVQTVKTLITSGCNPSSIRVAIDANGIISYEAKQYVDKHVVSKTINGKKPKSPELYTLKGQIGQIFEPNEYGVVHTEFANGRNKILIPGYDGYIIPPDDGNYKTVEERSRFIGYVDVLKSKLTDEIRRAASTQEFEYNYIPKTSSLNSIYSTINSTEIPENVYELYMNAINSNSPEGEIYKALFLTACGRVRFDNSLSDGASTMAQSLSENPHEEQSKVFDDYYYNLYDNKNIRVVAGTVKDMFCPICTGNATLAGVVRYLSAGAYIDPVTHMVVPASPREDGEPVTCPMLQHDMFKHFKHDTADRVNQSFNNIHIVALNTGVMLANCKGLTFEDGVIVTKQWAEAHPIMGEDGKMRPAKIGDKVCDCHGNKGVISFVADGNLSSKALRESIHFDATLNKDIEDKTLTETLFIHDNEEYTIKFDTKSKKSHMDQIIQMVQKKHNVDQYDEILNIVYDNPQLSIIMSPYALMSRFNGGSVAELYSHPDDVIINGKVIKGGMGYMTMILVDMPVDIKTKAYDESALKNGKGRKASGQLAWALESKNAVSILSEFYRNNKGAYDDLREYLITLGFDLTTDLKPVVGYHRQDHRNEKRVLIKSPQGDLSDLIGLYKVRNDSSGDMTPRFDTNKIHEYSSAFIERMNTTGGFLELPFPLHYNSVTQLKSKTNVDKCNELFDFQKTGHTYVSADGEKHETYAMPILPQNLRSNQEFQDGTSKVHEYTNRYLNIYKKSLFYRACQDKLSDDSLSDVTKANLKKQMKASMLQAQAEYDAISKDIADSKFNTKHNIIRDSIMTYRLPNSGTAVQTADSRLNLNEIAMSTEYAMKLGLVDSNGNWADSTNKGHILVWRDPILHDTDVKFMKVKINDSLTGVAINPMAAKPFDGDFDGDSLGLAVLQSKKSNYEAYNLFSFQNNMLNKGVKVDIKDPDTGEMVECHPLFVDYSMDAKSNKDLFHPELDDEFIRLTLKVNDIERKADSLKNGTLDPESVTANVRTKSGDMIKVSGMQAINAMRRDCFREENKWVHKALDGIGSAHIIMESEKTIAESYQKEVDQEAKGSQSKLPIALGSIGLVYKVGEDGRVDINTVGSCKDDDGNIHSLSDSKGEYYDDAQNTQEVAAFKADNTALGGSTAQRGVVACRNRCLFAVLELTYPITQAILQSKHDPKDAKEKDKIVRFWGKDVWDGYKLTGNFTSDDPDVIINQSHTREKRLVLDSKGNPIPRCNRVPRLNMDGTPLLDENGKPQYDYETMVDDNGNPIYEEEFVKCTKAEWIQQIKGMFCALKVPVNNDLIDELANNMTNKNPSPVISAYTGRAIFVDGKPLMREGNDEIVIGFEDFATMYGSLLDKMAYTNKGSALVDAALSNSKEYQMTLTDSQKTLQGMNESKSLADGLDYVVDKYIDLQNDLRKLINDNSDEKDLKFVNNAINTIRNYLPNSSMFVPDTLIQSAIGDRLREQTGEDTVSIVKYVHGEYREVNINPVPLGRQKSMLTDPNSLDSFMGENEDEYFARRDFICQRNQANGVLEADIMVGEIEVNGVSWNNCDTELQDEQNAVKNHDSNIESFVIGDLSDFDGSTEPPKSPKSLNVSIVSEGTAIDEMIQSEEIKKEDSIDSPK